MPGEKLSLDGVDVPGLVASLTPRERSQLREAFDLLEGSSASGASASAGTAPAVPSQEQLDLADSVLQCHLTEFVIDKAPLQVFLNGDRLFGVKPADKDVELPDMEYLEFVEKRPALEALPTVAQWIEKDYPGFVKMYGCVVDDREAAVQDRKALGIICEKASEALPAFMQTSEGKNARGDHKMYFALTAFQAWNYFLYLGPCLPVFTLENVVVKKHAVADSDSDNPFSAHLRLQLPTAQYRTAMGEETLDTNVCQLADVLWFVLHGDAQTVAEKPRVEKPLDGGKVWKNSCKKMLESLYEHKSQSQRHTKQIVTKMQHEYLAVREMVADGCAPILTESLDAPS
ncbi:unnamed protein product [Effrenium voratum]|nr:unnamed protein product [Effrenium voratum]